MSLARGMKRGRLAIIQEHRMERYLAALDRLIAGEATPDYVAERGRKLVKIRKGKRRVT